MEKYLSSENVKAFPASWRGAESGDPESSLTTETSLRRLAYARFSHRSTAYFDQSSGEFVIVVDGYVFVVSPIEGQSGLQAAVGNITDLFSDVEPPVTDIYAGITVAAMGMTVGDTQYNVANGLFEQLRSSNSTNNALDGVPAGSELSSFYGLRLFDSMTPEPTGLSAYLHILHRDKLEGEEYGDWYIPEESRFVTDTNQVQNRGGGVSIGTRFDTKEVYATPSGEMPLEQTNPPYSRLDSDGLKVASSKDSDGVFSIEAHADMISLSAPTDGSGGTSSASLAKSAESLIISDKAKIEVSAPTVSIAAGEGNSIGMSEGGPIEVVGANGISLDNSSTSEPIVAKSAKITMKSRSVAFESDSDSSEANVNVTGSLSVSHRGVFGTRPDGSGDAPISEAIGAVSLFWNGMEYKAIEVSSSVSVPDLFKLGLMMNLGDSYRSLFLVKGVSLRGVYASTGVGGGLAPLEDDGDYYQLWDLTFTFQPVRTGKWSCLAIGRLIGEWHKAQDGPIKNVLDENGFPYDATLGSSFNDSTGTTFAALLDKQVRTSTVPTSTVSGWFND